MDVLSTWRGPLSLYHRSLIMVVILVPVLGLIEPLLALIPVSLLVAVIVIAPFFPAFSFYLPVVSRGRREQQAVALTFDDGPDVSVTPRLLDLLKEHGVKATFFLVGKKVETNPAIVRRILDEGHDLGNHSQSHDPLLMFRSRTRIKSEIEKAQETFAPFGVRPRYFRPPAGVTGPRLKPVLTELGMLCVNFSRRARDFGNRRKVPVSRILGRSLAAGDIILLHDISPDGGLEPERVIQEFDQLIRDIMNKGYSIVSLEELTGFPVMDRI